jgi:hypothetical protein
MKDKLWIDVLEVLGFGIFLYLLGAFIFVMF